MFPRTRLVALGPVLGGLLLLAAAGAAQEAKVYRNVSTEKLEQILKGLDVDFKKSAGPKAGIHYYDFTRNNFKVRLHNYDGQDLWIDCIFSDKLSLEDVNRWNVKAKFSRAVLVKDGDKSSVSLENQLDCLGGVTDAIVRQFITRFDGEVKNFVQFVSK